jgi:hypothetical protein
VWSPAAPRRLKQETASMRIYIIGNDGITLCREPPATVNKGDVAIMATLLLLYVDDGVEEVR